MTYSRTTTRSSLKNSNYNSHKYKLKYNKKIHKKAKSMSHFKKSIMNKNKKHNISRKSKTKSIELIKILLKKKALLLILPYCLMHSLKNFQQFDLKKKVYF